MFNTIENTQTIADLFKGFVDASQNLDKAARIGAMRSIKELERCGWHGPAMQAAFDKAGIQLTEEGLSFSTKGKGALAAIEQAISIYFEFISHKPDPLAQVFDMEEAAEYLGISKEMMYTYVTRQQRLRGKKVGNSMAFSRQQLDAFKRTMRRPGKPASE